LSVSRERGRCEAIADDSVAGDIAQIFNPLWTGTEASYCGWLSPRLQPSSKSRRQMPATHPLVWQQQLDLSLLPDINAADVGLERNQPSHIDQSIVSAAINISRSVFAPAAGHDLTD